MRTNFSPMSVNTKKIFPKSFMAFVFPKDIGFYREFCLSINVIGSLVLCLRKSLPGDLLHEWKGGTKEEN